MSPVTQTAELAVKSESMKQTLLSPPWCAHAHGSVRRRVPIETRMRYVRMITLTGVNSLLYSVLKELILR
jgi:hypothetical protein